MDVHGIQQVTSPQKILPPKGVSKPVMSLNNLSVASKAYTGTIDDSSTTKRDITLSIAAYSLIWVECHMNCYQAVVQVTGTVRPPINRVPAIPVHSLFM